MTPAVVEIKESDPVDGPVTGTRRNAEIGPGIALAIDGPRRLAIDLLAERIGTNGRQGEMVDEGNRFPGLAVRRGEKTLELLSESFGVERQVRVNLDGDAGDAEKAPGARVANSS